MTVEIQRKQFTVRDYARMRETNILSEDDRVELIDGEIRLMSPIGPSHAAIVKRLNTLIGRILADRALLSVQDPIQLNNYSEPEPDLAILQPRDDFYAHGHPQAEDVLLLIEVADSSFENDRDEKIPRYADAGIVESWLINVHNLTIEQYTEPRYGRYRTIHLLTVGESITAVTIPDIQIRLDYIFGIGT